MKYELWVISIGMDELNDPWQKIATFENVDEDFMNDIVPEIEVLRDVVCRYNRVPAEELGTIDKQSTNSLKAEIAALVNLFPATIPVDGCHTALVGLVYKLRQLSAV